MIAGILIITFSVILFVYWFRYSCILLLRDSDEASGAQVEDAQFNVAGVIERLKAGCELDPLERTLERDYHLVTYLIEHAADLELASVESRLLLFDYKLMRLWSKVTRTVAPVQSRKALAEMASVLSVLVRKMGAPAGMQLEA